MNSDSKKLSKAKVKSFFIDTLVLIAGCAIAAFATASILEPNGLSNAGITGLSISFEKITGISYVYAYYVMASIIIVLTLIFLGKKEVLKILFLALLFPTFLKIYNIFGIEVIIEDRLLAIMIFSLVGGFGAGLCFRKGFSFGGMDTVAKIFQTKLLPFMTLGKILLFFDALVVLILIYVLGLDVALYTVIAQIIYSRIIDYVAIGMGMKIYKHDIISCKNEEITNYILTELKRGVTQKIITGAYTKKDSIQITCICSPKESVQLKKFISSIDKTAFVEVIPLSDVWGNGKRFSTFK